MEGVSADQNAPTLDPTAAPRNTVAMWTAAALAVTALVTAVPTPASAVIDPAGQDCFTVLADPGGAAVVNLTPVRASAAGNGQLISSDIRDEPPVASNVNFAPGTRDPNVAITTIGTDNQICFQNSNQATVDLVADHLGTIARSAYTPATTNGAPARLVDTRTGQGGTTLAPNGQLCFTINGNPGDAAVVNLTPIRATTNGNGQLISSDVKNNPPIASNVNFAPGTRDPNVAITTIGTDNQVCFQNSNQATVDLVADHLGTIARSAYAPATTNGAPARLVDTRTGQGGTTLAPNGQLCFTIGGNPGDAAVVNLTPIRATTNGNGQLISSDVKNNPPIASNVNFAPGTRDPNVAITTIGTDGQVCFQNSNQATVDLVADHLGTIADGAYTPATTTRVRDTRDETRAARGLCDLATTNDWDVETSRVMLGLSNRAYDVDADAWDIEDLLDRTPTSFFRDEMGCWRIEGIVKSPAGTDLITDTEVVIAQNIDTMDLAVSFRGTDGLRDVVTDILAVRFPWRYSDGTRSTGDAHLGFAAAYDVVSDQVLNVLRAHQSPETPGARVFFTGHSLGGALATLASLDLVDELMDFGYDRREVLTYTFGAPRSMTENLADEHAQRVPNSFAFANPRDFVSHVPTPVDSTGDPFSHVHNMIVLNGELGSREIRRDEGDGRDYRACPAPMWTPDLLLLHHDRSQYRLRIDPTTIYGTPDVWVTRVNDPVPLGIDNLVMNWDDDRIGPCDEVGLWDRSSPPTSISDAVRDRWISIDGNGQHTTTRNVDEANWIGYKNIFGDIISLREFDLAR